MNAAIIIAGALIAGAIMLTNHWALGPFGAHPPVLMNRWTGTVVFCRLEPPERERICRE
jgi:hypothetical protein